MRTMTIFKLVNRSATGFCQQLITHTDTANRLCRKAHLLSYNVYGILTHIRIAGAIGKEQSVEVHIRIIIVPRNAYYLYTSVQKTSDNVILYAAVNKNNLLSGSFVVTYNLLAAYFVYKVNTFIVCCRDIVRLIIKKNLAHHYTMLAQYLCKLTRVDARYSRNVLALKPVCKTFNSIPMRIHLAVICNNYCRCIYLITFHESGNSIVFHCERWYTIVSYQRIRKYHQLTCIRWVCQTLGITHHSRIKHHLACYGRVISE